MERRVGTHSSSGQKETKSPIQLKKRETNQARRDDPSATEFEPGWPTALVEGLRRRGHEAREVDIRFGGIQAIQVLEDGRVVGVSDPRRLGGVAQTGKP